MTLRSPKGKLEPGATYVAWTSFASDSPAANTAVAKGARLRGDDPIVRAHPTYFVRAGERLPDEQLATATGTR